MSTDNPRHRLGLLAVCAISLFGALFARLWFLQIVEGPGLEAQVNSMSQRVVINEAPRGRILDRNGTPLVENRVSIVVAVDYQEFDTLDDEQQDQLLERLGAALSRWLPPAEAVTAETLERRINDPRFSHFRPIPVAEDITVEQEIYFREQADRFPAVTVEHQLVRSYPYGSLAAHVLGYVGAITEEEFAARAATSGDKPYERSDEIGKAGVERTYEQYLRGTPGRQVFEVDRRNRVVREITAMRLEPVPGDDVHLAIDARLQYKTEEALQARILASESPTPHGAATVLDPRNGQVLAMASYPTYDPAQLVGGMTQAEYAELTAAPAKKLSNRAIQEAYPAASTFKLATSYAGLQLGIITPDGIVQDQGVLQLCPGVGQGCQKKNSGGGAAMGGIDLATALSRSSDYYYYLIGVDAWRRHQNDGLPEDALQQQIQVLGYGEKTGIDLTAERAGRVPTPESQRELADSLWERSRDNYGNDEAQWQDARRWKAGYSADVAIGQYDTLVTPLQTANAYASLANDQGHLYQPSVLSHVSRTRAPDDVVLAYQAELIRTIDYGEARPALLEGFRRATHDTTSGQAGTAAAVFSSFPLETFPVSGKTGTAEVGDDADQRTDNSLFVGFGPNPEDQYVVSVMIEGGGFGANAAAPAAHMILRPVADGSLESFEIPPGGIIDAEAAAEDTTITAVGAD